MQKLSFLILAAALLLALTGCDAAPIETAPPAETTAVPTTEPAALPTTEPLPSEKEIIARIEDCIRGKKFDPQTALELAQALADRGSAAGMYYMGDILLDGLGKVEQDVPQALQWLEQGAALDNSDCMTLLGFVYVYGAYNQPQDVELGISWMEKGAGLGNYACMNNLGNYLSWNGDPAEGIMWLEQALEDPDEHTKGHVYLNIGSAYVQLGDYVSAQENFEKSIEYDPEAYRYLGDMLRDNVRDYNAALACYQEGAEAGNTGCLLGIGEMYERGLGVPQNRDTAREWFWKAQEAGDYLAQEALDRVK